MFNREESYGITSCKQSSKVFIILEESAVGIDWNSVSLCARGPIKISPPQETIEF